MDREEHHLCPVPPDLHELFPSAFAFLNAFLLLLNSLQQFACPLLHFYERFAG
jgi:hypothetical protein